MLLNFHRESIQKLMIQVGNKHAQSLAMSRSHSRAAISTCNAQNRADNLFLRRIMTARLVANVTNRRLTTKPSLKVADARRRLSMHWKDGQNLMIVNLFCFYTSA